MPFSATEAEPREFKHRIPEAIRVRNLSHRYERRVALRSVSFTVAPREIFGFLGPNGGGKSTLFRILTTLISPTEGEVRLLGRNPSKQLNEVRREMGVVFQAPSLDLLLTARENLIHQGHLYGLRGRELRKRTGELLDRFGLADRSGDRVGGFSGGMRRRLEIAKALLHGPRLLILDEPSTGLDPSARRVMWDHLDDLRRSQGVTVVLTTHLMEEAEGCDRLGILDQGVLVAVDEPVALKEEVGGDVVTVEADRPPELAASVSERFGVEAAVVRDQVRVERPRGHELAAALVEAFPGRIRSVSVGKPTLEDVFVHLTGRDLAQADAEARDRRGAGTDQEGDRS